MIDRRDFIRTTRPRRLKAPVAAAEATPATAVAPKAPEVVDGAATRILNALIELTDAEQQKAFKLDKGPRTILTLAQRDHHVARASAFLEAAQLAQKETKA